MKQSRILDSAIFDQVAAVIGSDLALQLCARFGGTALYVPHKATAEHPIADAVGLDAAKLLSKEFTGETLTLPNITRQREMVLKHRRVRELAAQGNMTAKQIAIATGYTERHVHNITGESGDDPRQFKLFDLK
jgi:AraC-like DNA-binding protein